MIPITVDLPIPSGRHCRSVSNSEQDNKIVTIDGKSAIKMKEDDVKKNLRGPKGTKVTVGIDRYGETQPIDFTITRDVIPIVSVMAHFMVDPTTGYIDVGRFAGTTYDELMEALNDLNAKGMQRLVLDLRDNPGGYLEQAGKFADVFIGGTIKIVFTKSRHSNLMKTAGRIRAMNMKRRRSSCLSIMVLPARARSFPERFRI